MYRCSRCQHEMSRPQDVCPNCQAVLSGVRCDECGHYDSKEVFIRAGHRCPKCNAAVHIPTSASTVPSVGENAAEGRCPGCGKKKSLGTNICEHCGHVEWGWILFFIFLGLAILAAGVFIPSMDFWLLVAGKWVLIVVGVLICFMGLSDVWPALRTPKKQPGPGDGGSEASGRNARRDRTAEKGPPRGDEPRGPSAGPMPGGGLARAGQLTELVGSQLDTLEAALGAMESAHEAGDESAKEEIMGVVELSGELADALTRAGPVDVELMLPKVKAASGAAVDGDFVRAREWLDDVAELLAGKERELPEVLEALQRFRRRLEGQLDTTE